MNEITSGEILRRFDAIDKKLEELPSAIASEFVRRELFESEHGHLSSRVKALEDSHQWITRFVVGIIVGAIVSATIVIG